MVASLVFTALLLTIVEGPDREPVIGLPCEGCEYVYVGMPDELKANARIAPADEPGEALIIDGMAYTADGNPAPGVIVYGYQTDAGGLYPKGTTSHGALRGWVRTDGAGRYRFLTIRPGSYPGRDTPQHIHLHVIEPSKGTYYIDDISFTDDPKLTAADRNSQGCRAGCGLSEPKRDKEGNWRVSRDIILGQNIPGHE